MGHPEILQVRDVRIRHRLQQPSRGRSLQRESGGLLGNILDLNVHVQAILAEPSQAGIGGCPAVGVLGKARNCSVVDDLAMFVAPTAIDHLSNGNFIDVTSDYAIDELGRVASGDHVLVQRGYVDQRGGIANRVVLVLMVYFVNANGVISRPLPVVQAVTQRKGSLVKCSSNWQRIPSCSAPDYMGR